MKPNQIIAGDCIENLKQLEDGCVDLVFADPPFNIGYKYDVYDDRKSVDEYLDWSEQWISEVHRVLKPTGTFWLAIGDDFAAELKVLANRTVGFHLRNWVIWYYTFGVNCKKKFTRSHTHLFYFVRDGKDFTFNADDPEIRIPSARQLVYGDKRANPKGRLPDDTWVLRPQDIPESFSEGEDTWYFPRVAGTFKERAGFHGCQMPEQLLGRIVRSCSAPGDLVLDPFGGSGSTLVVAKKLGRDFLGFELSEDYVGQIQTRLDETEVGTSLNGEANPLTSAPSTKDGRRLDARGGTSAEPKRKKKAAGAKKRLKPESVSQAGVKSKSTATTQSTNAVEAESKAKNSAGAESSAKSEMKSASKAMPTPGTKAGSTKVAGGKPKKAAKSKAAKSKKATKVRTKSATKAQAKPAANEPTLF